jgi:hypothetical protein
MADLRVYPRKATAHLQLILRRSVCIHSTSPRNRQVRQAKTLRQSERTFLGRRDFSSNRKAYYAAETVPPADGACGRLGVVAIYPEKLTLAEKYVVHTSPPRGVTSARRSVNLRHRWVQRRIGIAGRQPRLDPLPQRGEDTPPRTGTSLGRQLFFRVTNALAKRMAWDVPSGACGNTDASSQVSTTEDIRVARRLDEGAPGTCGEEGKATNRTWVSRRQTTGMISARCLRRTVSRFSGDEAWPCHAPEV